MIKFLLLNLSYKRNYYINYAHNNCNYVKTGEKLYPKHSGMSEPAVSEEVLQNIPAEESRVADDEAAAVPGPSTAASTFGNDEGFADGDEDTQDSVLGASTNASSSKTSGFNLPSLLESDDSEFEDLLDNIIERGKTILKKGNVSSKYPPLTSSGCVLVI